MTYIVAVAALDSVVLAADDLVTDGSLRVLQTPSRAKIFEIGGHGVASAGGSSCPGGVPARMAQLAAENDRLAFDDLCALLISDFRPHADVVQGHSFLVVGYENAIQRLAEVRAHTGRIEELFPTETIWTFSLGVVTGHVSLGMPRINSTTVAYGIAQQLSAQAASQHRGVGSVIHAMVVNRSGLQWLT